MNMMLSQNCAEAIRKQFPAGTRVVLDRMVDDPRPIPPGTHGTVRFVDDLGDIHVSWDNGRGLAIIPDVDEYHKEVC